MNDKKNVVAREGACQLIQTLCEQGVGNAVEPFIFEKVLPLLVKDAFADKITGVREASVASVLALVKIMTPWATGLLLPIILHEIHTAGKWQVKVGALQVLDSLVKHAPLQVSRAMSDIIPVLADTIHDTKADVKKAARSTLTTVCALISNKDIEK